MSKIPAPRASGSLSAVPIITRSAASDRAVAFAYKAARRRCEVNGNQRFIALYQRMKPNIISAPTLAQIALRAPGRRQRTRRGGGSPLWGHASRPRLCPVSGYLAMLACVVTSYWRPFRANWSVAARNWLRAYVLAPRSVADRSFGDTSIRRPGVRRPLTSHLRRDQPNADFLGIDML